MEGEAKIKKTLPLYRHPELYEWNKEFQKRKFFTKKDFTRERRLEHLYRCGKNDQDPDECCMEYVAFRFEDRYKTLSQGTRFFRNLAYLNDERYGSGSYQEMVLKCSAAGIGEGKVKFYLLYVQMNPGRFFMYADLFKEYEALACLPEDEAEETIVSFPISKGIDCREYVKFYRMYRRAFAGGIDCCSYAEFVEREF